MSGGGFKITQYPEVDPLWQPDQSAPSTGTVSGGDITGTLPADVTVIAIQGTPVSSTAPTTGQLLYFDGTQWIPATVIGEGTHAARPAAATGNTGWLYHETDLTGGLYRSTGSAWNIVAPGTLAVVAAGLTGATAASRYVGATASGAPASGTFAIGDFAIDQTGLIWICTVAGTPGTWTSVATAITVEDEGTPLATAATILNFVGAGVTATGTGSTKTITIPGAAGGNASGQFIVGIDGGGLPLIAGKEQDVDAPFTGTITDWLILADTAGSAVIDIWKTTYAGNPPTVANTITGSAKPTISGAVKAASSTLTGWTTAVTTGDTLRFHLDSVATITRLLLVINYSRP